MHVKKIVVLFSFRVLLLKGSLALNSNDSEAHYRGEEWCGTEFNKY